MDERSHGARARDAGLARLRRATRAVIFGATALAGAATGLAANSFSGHKPHTAAVTTRTVRQAQTQTAPTEQDDQQPATTQAAPVTTTAAPAVTTQAPVATSGAT